MLLGGVLGALLASYLGLAALFVSSGLAAVLAVAFRLVPHGWQLRYLAG